MNEIQTPRCRAYDANVFGVIHHKRRIAVKTAPTRRPASCRRSGFSREQRTYPTRSVKFGALLSNFLLRGMIQRPPAAETLEATLGQKPRRRDSRRATGRQDDARSSPDQGCRETGDGFRSRTPTGPGAVRGPRAGAAGPARSRRPGRDSTPARAIPHASSAGRSTATTRFLVDLHAPA